MRINDALLSRAHELAKIHGKLTPVFLQRKLKITREMANYIVKNVGCAR